MTESKTYTAYVAARSRKSRTVPWEGLHAQMGAEYAHIRMFRINVRLAIKKKGMVVGPTPLAITSKS